jgi:hypothetical protein
MAGQGDLGASHRQIRTAGPDHAPQNYLRPIRSFVARASRPELGRACEASAPTK